MPKPPVMRLKAKRHEVLYAAAFAAPAFAALPSEGRIYGAIHGRFASYGAALGDIRVDASGPTLGDVSVSCNLHALSVLVRFRLNRVEVWWGGLGGRADIAAIMEDAIGALRDVSPDSKVEGHLLHTTFHGEAKSGDVGRWLTNYVRRPPDEVEPEFAPSGVSFRAAIGPSETGYFLVERSLLVAGGAFVRVTCEFPGAVPPRAAWDRTASFLSTSLERFGIELAEGA